MEIFESTGSGWSLSRILHLSVQINKYTPLSAGKYIDLPDAIKRKRAVINVQNLDNKCFCYALVAAHFPPNNNLQDPSSYPRNFNRLYNLEGINFPVKIKDIPKFERQNPEISVNVFGLDGDKVVGPYYRTEKWKTKHVNMLYWENEAGICHYAFIKNLSRLCRSDFAAKQCKAYICDRCLRYFWTAEKLKNHIDDCSLMDPCKITFPKPGEDFLYFKNLNYNLRHPFCCYFDLECLTVPCSEDRDVDDDDDDQNTSYTIPYQKHVPFAIGYQIVCSFDNTLSHYRSYRGENPQKWFIEQLQEESRIIEKKLKINIPMIPLTLQEQIDYNNTDACKHCMKLFSQDVIKVRNHDHFTGKFISALCQDCNLQYKCGNYLPIISHNLSGYDIHFLINELDFSTTPINVLPLTREDYISVSKKFGEITWRFIDSYRFLPQSLEVLARNLTRDMFKFVKDTFPPQHLDLMVRKGIFPYDYVNSWEKLNETRLPSKDAFYSILREENISDADYEHANKVWDTFNIQNIGQYTDLYLKLDVKILTDVFEQFRNLCMEIYDLDSAHFYTGPGLTFNAALKTTKVKMQLIHDIDVVLFFEKSLRGGLCQCSHRYTKANNKYMPNYDETQQKNIFLTYWDANNLYGLSMSQNLPIGNFQWLPNACVQQIENKLQNLHFNEDTFTSYEDYSDRLCMQMLGLDAQSNNDGDGVSTSLLLEVDFKYPVDVHDKHQDLPFCPQHMVPPSRNPDEKKSTQNKLMLTLYDKKKYVTHIRNLIHCMRHGLQVEKVHRVLQFSQAPWLKEYIELNTRMRSQATDDFSKTFFKNMNNQVYGRTLLNIRKHRNIKLITSWASARKLISKPAFQSVTIFKENLIAVEMNKESIKYNTPVYAGMVILELSKLIMYSFHYDFIKNYVCKKYQCEAKLCYCDTDGFVYMFTSDNDQFDVYNIIKEESEKGIGGIFDTSDYPADNQFGIKRVNNKILGKFKDEANGSIITEFIGLRSKMYSIRKEGENWLDKAKGVGRTALKNRITFDTYYDTLFNNFKSYATSCTIRSKKHEVYSFKIKKKALDASDNKRYILQNSIDTLPWGHYAIPPH